MEYVGPSYNYKYWMQMFQYTQSMHWYGLSASFLQLKDKDQNRGATLYIDKSPKLTRNIVGFINSTQLGSTLKQPKCIFEGLEGNCVFICSIKSIARGEELLINYNLNWVDTNTVTMDVVHPTIYPTFF